MMSSSVAPSGAMVRKSTACRVSGLTMCRAAKALTIEVCCWSVMVAVLIEDVFDRDVGLGVPDDMPHQALGLLVVEVAGGAGRRVRMGEAEHVTQPLLVQLQMHVAHDEAHRVDDLGPLLVADLFHRTTAFSSTRTPGTCRFRSTAFCASFIRQATTSSWSR